MSCITTNFILRSVSHKGFEAHVGFARHGYSLPAQADQAIGQPPRLIINRGGQCKPTVQPPRLISINYGGHLYYPPRLISH